LNVDELVDDETDSYQDVEAVLGPVAGRGSDPSTPKARGRKMRRGQSRFLQLPQLHLCLLLLISFPLGRASSRMLNSTSYP
jgi:hypothetical protein